MLSRKKSIVPIQESTDFMTSDDATVGKALETFLLHFCMSFGWAALRVSAQSQLISLITQCQRRINFTGTSGKR